MTDIVRAQALEAQRIYLETRVFSSEYLLRETRKLRPGVIMLLRRTIDDTYDDDSLDFVSEQLDRVQNLVGQHDDGLRREVFARRSEDLQIRRGALMQAATERGLRKKLMKQFNSDDRALLSGARRPHSDLQLTALRVLLDRFEALINATRTGWVYTPPARDPHERTVDLVMSTLDRVTGRR